MVFTSSSCFRSDDPEQAFALLLRCLEDDDLPVALCGPHRVTAPPPETLHASVLAALSRLPAPDAAWCAGEFDTAQAARALFRRRWNLGKARQMSIAYWRRGATGN